MLNETKAAIPQKIAPEDSIEATVVVSSSSNDFSVDDILSKINEFAENDDVYCEEFGKSLVFQTTSENRRRSISILQKLRSLSRFRKVLVLGATSPADLLPSGPYFIQGKNIHQAWRLYPDELDAFVTTVVPTQITSPSR